MSPPLHGLVDVVQRCIEAGAEQVDVAVEFAGAGSWVRVAATGAAGAALHLDLSGSSRTATATPDGLDLAAGALAVGASVTVRHVDARGEPVSLCWGAAGAGRADGESARITEIASGSTVVLIEALHEVHAYKRQEGRVIEGVVTRMRTRAGDALGLAFHRHLAGRTGRRRRVGIALNAEPVAPLDPFASDRPALRLRRRDLPFLVGARAASLVARPHVLSAAPGEAASARQGFFVYLRDRLVQAGGWSRLNVADRRDGIVRIAVDLPPAALDGFAWEPAQRRVLFPIGLAPALRALAVEAVTAPLSSTGTLGMASVGG